MAKKRPRKESPEKPGFEESLQRLEGIVHLLEEGDLGLTEALARYEEGVRLLRQAYDLLEHAERRIELLSGVDAEGNPISRPLEDQATLSQQSQQQAQRSTAADAGPGEGCGRPQPRETDIDAPEGLF